MQIIVTGGICTGKSTACKVFEENGFHIIDADKIAHDMLDKNIFSIKKLFGNKYIVNGKVDRKKLGSLVFEDEKEKEKLESLLHPLIREEIKKSILKLEENQKRYILDIPLFFEKGGYVADKVILIYASKEEQIKRLQKRNFLSFKEAQKRLNAQMNIEKKKELSDIVIENMASIEELKNNIKKVIDADFKI